jgi:hypothetical protein
MVGSLLPNDMYPRVLHYVRYRTEIGDELADTTAVVIAVSESGDLRLEV